AFRCPSKKTYPQRPVEIAEGDQERPGVSAAVKFAGVDQACFALVPGRALWESLWIKAVCDDNGLFSRFWISGVQPSAGIGRVAHHEVRMPQNGLLAAGSAPSMHPAPALGSIAHDPRITKVGDPGQGVKSLEIKTQQVDDLRWPGSQHHIGPLLREETANGTDSARKPYAIWRETPRKLACSALGVGNVTDLNLCGYLLAQAGIHRLPGYLIRRDYTYLPAQTRQVASEAQHAERTAGTRGRKMISQQ